MCQQYFIRFACSHIHQSDRPCDKLIESSSPLQIIFCDHYTVHNYTQTTRCGRSGNYCKHTRAGQFLDLTFEAILGLRDQRAQHQNRKLLLLRDGNRSRKPLIQPDGPSEVARLTQKIAALDRKEQQLVQQIRHVAHLAASSAPNTYLNVEPSPDMTPPTFEELTAPLFRNPFVANFKPPDEAAQKLVIPNPLPRANPSALRSRATKSSIVRSLPSRDKASRQMAATEDERVGKCARRRSRRIVSRPVKYVESDSEDSAHEKESDDDDTKGWGPLCPREIAPVKSVVPDPSHFASIDSILHRRTKVQQSGQIPTPSRTDSPVNGNPFTRMTKMDSDIDLMMDTKPAGTPEPTFFLPKPEQQSNKLTPTSRSMLSALGGFGPSGGSSQTSKNEVKPRLFQGPPGRVFPNGASQVAPDLQPEQPGPQPASTGLAMFPITGVDEPGASALLYSDQAMPWQNQPLPIEQTYPHFPLEYPLHPGSDRFWMYDHSQPMYCADPFPTPSFVTPLQIPSSQMAIDSHQPQAMYLSPNILDSGHVMEESEVDGSRQGFRYCQMDPPMTDHSVYSDRQTIVTEDFSTDEQIITGDFATDGQIVADDYATDEQIRAAVAPLLPDSGGQCQRDSSPPRVTASIRSEIEKARLSG